MSHEEFSNLLCVHTNIKKTHRVKTRNITENLCFNNCIHESVVEEPTTIMLLLIRYRS